MVEIAKTAKSVEELLALAKEHKFEMNEEEAKAYFAKLNPKSGELDDDDLDNVAGGGCGADDDPFPNNGTLVTARTATCHKCGGNQGTLQVGWGKWWIECTCGALWENPVGLYPEGYAEFAAEFEW